MKDLKYIKLFEAFESLKLAKTLKFIDRSSRRSFIQDIKSLCNRMDFPLSEISDDLFEYLPYKKAVNYHSVPITEPCNATSEQEFYSNSIPGEKCESGRIKRTWGSRVRSVICPHCKGTGFEPPKPKWKYVKFWFSVNKKFIGETATNGEIFGEGLHKYDKIIDINYGSVASKRWSWSDSEITNFLKDANFALVLDLDKLDKKSLIVKNTATTKNNRENLKNVATSFKSNDEIKRENVRRYFNQLIERSKVKANFDEIKNLNKLFLRLLMGNKILYVIHPSSNSDALRKMSNIGDEIYEIMSSLQDNDSQENRDNLVDRVDSINYHIKSSIEDLQTYKEIIGKAIRHTDNYINVRGINTRGNVFSKNILKNINEINSLLFKYISTYRIETLYDYEDLLSELASISDLMTQNRYGLYKIRYFFDKSTSRYSYDNAVDYITSTRLYDNELELVVQGTNRFIDFLKNKYSL